MIKTEKCYIPLHIEPLLVDAARLAVILSVSVSHVHALDNAGKIPKARNLNKSKRWSTAEIREWIGAGCPDRIAWMQRGDNG